MAALAVFNQQAISKAELMRTASNVLREGQAQVKPGGPDLLALFQQFMMKP
jgi:hypothetical protein